MRVGLKRAMFCHEHKCPQANPSAQTGWFLRENNGRARAAAASQALPVLVVKEMQRHQKYLEQRMTRLRREALRLIVRDPELDRRFHLIANYDRHC